MSGYAKMTAVLSDDGAYRYALTRWWDESAEPLCVIGLNPSTADAEQDDPTIRRCVGFAKAWGYGGIVMLNLFAYRATDPKVMRRAFDPVGPQNDATLCASTGGRDVLCAWGTGGDYMARDRAVMDLLRAARSVTALGLTKDSHPRHPLYARSSARPVTFAISPPAPADGAGR